MTTYISILLALNKFRGRNPGIHKHYFSKLFMVFPWHQVTQMVSVTPKIMFLFPTAYFNYRQITAVW